MAKDHSVEYRAADGRWWIVASDLTESKADAEARACRRMNPTMRLRIVRGYGLRTELVRDVPAAVVTEAA